MTRTITMQEVLPVISETTSAFRNGYAAAQRNEEVGWNIKYAPREETIVQFLREAIDIINSDKLRGVDTEDGERWLAGLLTGWLRRPV